MPDVFPRILFVDDEPFILSSLTRLFRHDAYEILTASSGEEGLAVLRKNRSVPLVISDYRMPGMNGVEFLEQVYRERPDTVRIILSLYADLDSVLGAINRGHIYKFISKPWDNADLKITVANGVKLYNLNIRNKELTASLKLKNEELNRLNDHLEELVAERTRDLAVVQEKLMQSEKLAAIGTLAGGIAHDFNNMLGAIMGYAEMATMDPDDETQKHHLKQVLIAADRAKNLIRHILTFSRQTKHEKRPVDMKMIVKESMTFIQATLPAAVQTRCLIADDHYTINADVTQIHQIVLNLLTNAAQAMGERGGLLDVALSRITVEESDSPGYPKLPPGCYARLTVTDTGMGIDPAIKSRIFDPFFTTKDVGEGTGLGLSVVYGIVADHGGTVNVYSEPGKGATFEVCLPCADIPAVISESPEDRPLTGGRERILFVDDDGTLCTMVGLMLKSLGYTVTVTSSSTEALVAFEGSPASFDLVITDMVMPRTSGLELASRVRRSRPGMPIILCTGYNNDMDGDRIKHAGIAAFIEKPYSRETLGRLIRNVLDRDDKGTDR